MERRSAKAAESVDVMAAAYNPCRSPNDACQPINRKPTKIATTMRKIKARPRLESLFDHFLNGSFINPADLLVYDITVLEHK